MVDRGLRAVVQTEGITGSSIVSLQTMDPKLYPPLELPWKPKYVYIPSAPSQLGRLAPRSTGPSQTSSSLDVGELSGNLNRVLVTADAALKNLNQLDVKGISDEREPGDRRTPTPRSRRSRALAEDARADLRSMKLDAVGADAGRLLDDLDARLSVLIEKLSGVDVRSLNDTLAGTREAARSLNEALDQLKRYPSGFLFGGAPPPAPVLEKEKK